MTSCDLKSCYDRVAHTPAVLALTGFGAPQEPLLCLFHSIQVMQYTTRKSYGGSDQILGGLAEGFTSRPQGFGQGNGLASQGWTGVSTRMFEVMHLREKQTRFYTPISIHFLDLCGLAYVDDVDIFAGLNRDNDAILALEKIQDTVDCWESIAKVTGRAIKTNKIWWYLLYYKWDKNDKWSYGDLKEYKNPSIKSRNANGMIETLEYLPTNKGKKMLGVHLTPNDSNQLQIEKQRKSRV